jgi:hypothetical protein
MFPVVLPARTPPDDRPPGSGDELTVVADVLHALAKCVDSLAEGIPAPTLRKVRQDLNEAKRLVGELRGATHLRLVHPAVEVIDSV